MSEIKVDLVRWPKDEDWQRAKLFARNTMNKRGAGYPADEAWKRRMLKTRHSPIRTLMFTIRMEIPYWVSVHFARHKFGVEHYVTSQRNDRQDKYDRNSAPQDMPVIHYMDINAAELINMSGERLCNKAAEETRQTMRLICDAVKLVCPEFSEELKPKCARLKECPEMVTCSEGERR